MELDLIVFDGEFVISTNLTSALPGGPAATRICVGASVTWIAAQIRPRRTIVPRTVTSRCGAGTT